MSKFIFMKKLSIKQQLMMALFIIIIPSFLIGISSYIYSVDVITDKIVQSKFQIMDEKSKMLSALLQDIESRGQQIKLDNSVQQIMSKDYIAGNYEENFKVNQTHAMIEKVAFSNDDIASIYLVALMHKIKYRVTTVGFLNKEDMSSYSWYQEFDATSLKDTWIRTRLNEDTNYFKEYILTFVSPLQHTYNNKLLGHIIINIDENALNDILTIKALVKHEKIYLMDERDQLFYHSDMMYEDSNDELDLINYDGVKSAKGNFYRGDGKERTLIIYTTLPRYGWKLIYEIPQSVITGELKHLNVFFYSIFFLFTIVSIILAFFLYDEIVRPLKDFIVMMDDIGKGDFTIHDYDENTNNEVIKLYSNFNSMSEKIEALMETNVEMTLQKKDAEMRALQQQINPHFLYNTLDAINWLAVLNKQTDISNMVKNLSQFFRNVISTGKEFVTIKDELKHVQAYIEIERFRYKNRFKITYNIDKRLLKYRTLKLIIQPFVENALNHGFSHRNGEGEITIQIFSVNDDIYFEIIDDGKGMTKEQLHDIMERKSQGYGIQNVNNRIRIQYGDDYNVTIDSEVNKGTRVLIPIPREEFLQ